MYSTRTRIPAILSMALGCLLATGPAWAEPLGEALRSATETNKVAAVSQGKIDKISDQTDSLLDEYRALLERIDTLRVYNKQLEALLASQQRELASLKRQIDDVTVIEREIMPLMLSMIDGLDAFVQLDVPFLEDERHERVVFLRELMDRADVTVAEKYRRLLEAFQIENEYGRTIEAYRGSLESEGTSREVEYLRIGRVALIYQTRDGQEAAAWDASSDSWVELGGEYRNPIRQGLRIARKQAAPNLLRLPIPAPQPAAAGTEAAE